MRRKSRYRNYCAPIGHEIEHVDYRNRFYCRLIGKQARCMIYPGGLFDAPLTCPICKQPVYIKQEGN